MLLISLVSIVQAEVRSGAPAVDRRSPVPLSRHRPSRSVRRTTLREMLKFVGPSLIRCRRRGRDETGELQLSGSLNERPSDLEIAAPHWVDRLVSFQYFRLNTTHLFHSLCRVATLLLHTPNRPAVILRTQYILCQNG